MLYHRKRAEGVSFPPVSCADSYAEDYSIKDHFLQVRIARCFLYSEGESPVCFLNSLLKYNGLS